jgi:NADH:ubiquinone oxidoreductase subunit 6 (subunit J)
MMDYWNLFTVAAIILVIGVLGVVWLEHALRRPH